ncbi:hypothetical protein KQI63_07010 [bacterium]|nr:hypothetical protein [bacterium]
MKRMFIMLPIALLLPGLLLLSTALADEGVMASDEMSQGWTLEDVGLKTPESVFHDAEMDVYFVSNLGGPQPLEKDNNGFISKLNPDGTVARLKWVAGGENDVTLNAPKGMGKGGDELYVTDIDVLRVFDINTGAHKMDIPLPGATFANDVSVGKGIIYVTDTGANGAGAIYTVSFEGSERTMVVEELVRDGNLHNPNGIYEDHDVLYMVPYGGSEVFQVMMDGTYKTISIAPTGSLDGLVKLKDGRLAFTSWEGNCIYAMTMDGAMRKIYTDLESPADIGYDRGRNLILVPQFMKDRVVALPVK